MRSNMPLSTEVDHAVRAQYADASPQTIENLLIHYSHAIAMEAVQDRAHDPYRVLRWDALRRLLLERQPEHWRQR